VTKIIAEENDHVKKLYELLANRRELHVTNW